MYIKRKSAKLAVLGSVLCHIFLIWLLEAQVVTNTAKIPPSTSVMELRLVDRPLAPATTEQSARPSQRNVHNSEQHGMNNSSRLKSSAISTESIRARIAIDAPPPPERSASEPSTKDLLNQITDAVLKKDRADRTALYRYKPWLTDTEADTPAHQNNHTSKGDRIERVRTPLGTYCIITPNGATAYRNSSGLNIAGVSNCP